MEREKSCALVKIMFEVGAGLLLIALVTLLGGKMFDLPIVVLMTIIIASVTMMFVKQDREILNADMANSTQE
ncbi:hypothetical protein SAMN02910339_01066 [Lachnospiraceae bacterium YSD2013]|jgi:hypothetical protein|nr:hypothetical protein [Lachnospiraceae bacterium]MBO4824152.1 hypothetical protein [Lachnospiraceae bacterium]MBR5761550.1 hypothetical protein [Lachnospiraceae bacterium]MBR5994789.1 hypothetical protein [Lachnospiraceae bacterium]SCX07431.1 hypothetical protein SAMN02910339_01066 [Lachnospiraceae bacterium YSD2013]